MISLIQISNYKSIESLTLELGRINVFIGENGAGKSNILEAIALAGAAAADKLDNEFLTSRGIRVTAPELMRPAFEKDTASSSIKIEITVPSQPKLAFELSNDNLPYSKWHKETVIPNFRKFSDSIVPKGESKFNIQSDGESIESLFEKFLTKSFNDYLKENGESELTKEKEKIAGPVLTKLTYTLIKDKIAEEFTINSKLKDFLIYSPENSSLRLFEKEGQIEPLGINGEGILKLLHYYSSQESDHTSSEINKSLQILNWFEKFSISTDAHEERLIIKDRYLEESVSNIDQKSANEGFLFLLFYFTLFSSKITPAFFAIDNIDASLNPKLCQKLTSELTTLAKTNDKQAIMTTHNPAVLDGLNLDDDEQRLFIISRGRSGATKIKRILKPKSNENSQNYRLSELFIRGMLGGLPKGF